LGRMYCFERPQSGIYGTSICRPAAAPLRAAPQAWGTACGNDAGRKTLAGKRFPPCLENPLRETGFPTLPQALLLAGA
jgi:hypothetical protein